MVANSHRLIVSWKTACCTSPATSRDIHPRVIHADSRGQLLFSSWRRWITFVERCQRQDFLQVCVRGFRLDEASFPFFKIDASRWYFISVISDLSTEKGAFLSFFILKLQCVPRTIQTSHISWIFIFEWTVIRIGLNWKFHIPRNRNQICP